MHLFLKDGKNVARVGICMVVSHLPEHDLLFVKNPSARAPPKHPSGLRLVLPRGCICCIIDPILMTSTGTPRSSHSDHCCTPSAHQLSGSPCSVPSVSTQRDKGFVTPIACESCTKHRLLRQLFTTDLAICLQIQAACLSLAHRVISTFSVCPV